MSVSDHARKMTDEELIGTLQMAGGPLLAELVRRGYDVRLDARNSATGVPVFVASKRPRVVGS